MRIPLKYVPNFLHAYFRRRKRVETQRISGSIELEGEHTQQPSDDVYSQHSQMTASELVHMARHGELM